MFPQLRTRIFNSFSQLKEDVKEGRSEALSDSVFMHADPYILNDTHTSVLLGLSHEVYQNSLAAAGKV